ncbi:hypothetical protein CIL05_01210 [Virgibacillus profundi]|uniref:PIG-L domain-containing protein n=1 Tax=Virgibacillus profundi TaxID=2024555 RepID=A0A2A2IHN6_9BACI|nr:PIG-L family deacetylase [Virgibacillus profundi]PAV31299.1 hypothetical protein CIL05_01210 [Virgibacillus profundi]PXY55484.1 PIG-L family deacetylase [Virgibacillus profundi]
MSIKQKLMNSSKPVIVPITRLILKRHYRSTKTLSEIGDYQRILILAPHMDDETIGAGATLKLHANNGAQINCAMITDGSNSQSDLDRQELSKTRKLEMEKVKDILGITKMYYLDLPDSSFKSNENSQNKLNEIIQEVQPDIIYCTPFVDAHIDHTNTTKLLADTLKKMDYPCGVRLYEINCPIPPLEINCVIDVTTTMKYKKEAISVFSSQQIAFDGFLELNSIKKALVNNPNTRTVETFLELNSNDFIKQFEIIQSDHYNYSVLFKQVNRSVTLLWAIFKNYKLKKEIYNKGIS